MSDKVLIAYSSKHGSTAEIAAVIGERIVRDGLEAEVRPVREVQSVDPYEAVIVGSVVQVGRWQGDAVDFLKRFEAQLRARPTWLFSSGPTGGSEKADAEVEKVLASPESVPRPKNMEPYATRIGPRGHATFPGKVGNDVGGIFAKWVPKGDWRDFDAIRAWADEIATNLKATLQPAST